MDTIVKFVDLRFVVSEEQRLKVVSLCEEMYEAESNGTPPVEAGQILLQYVVEIFNAKPMLLNVGGVQHW